MRIHASLAAAATMLWLASSSADAAKITISQYGRIAATLPWAVALEKGMFKAAGLDIDGITPGSGGGTTLRNTLASELPYGEVSSSVAIAAVNQGIPIVAVAAASNHVGELAWATKPDSGINSLKDLVGKKVAYTNPRSTTEQVIRTAIADAGLTGKIQVLPLGGLGPALTALAQGAVAAAPLNDPLMTLHPERYKILFHAYEIYPKFTWQMSVTTKAFAQQHPDVVRKIVEVHRKAVQYTYAHREEAERIYAKVWKVSVDEAAKILPKYYDWHHWSEGDFSKQGLDAVVKGLMLVGELKQPFDWSKLIDQQYLPKDLRRPL